ncbi:MAG: 16S rRNA (guanine(966)-N(2))-methyltransferase RsmD [Candidatus Rokubacteria bacterium]|nr:16S rRNA (guanine(966)-N(2))-methyltransferase RsmD [Candidatus Rokubacteria bacterium]
MRVLAGVLKGRKLVTPKGDRTRPTADQVRIALLDTLTPWLPDARVLDLFAGAGGVGFEALSRGAAHATFVERDARAVAALRENVETLGVRDHARIMRGDVARELVRLHTEGARFDIVFLDPPYEADAVAPTLVQLGGGSLIAPGGVVIAQHLTKKAPAERIGALIAFRTRRFGETTLTFYRAGAAG